MTVLELINALETCEDTFEVVLEEGSLEADEWALRVEQIPASPRGPGFVRICYSKEFGT